MAMTDVDHTGSLVLPKKVSLAIAIGFVVQLVVVVYHFGSTQAADRGDIDRLKRDVASVAQIRESTIRLEEQVSYIRILLERQGRH